MIFVTVGTHEQQFNRLIEYIDNLIKSKEINKEVIMQIGYSTYIPQNCEYKKMIGYDEMNKLAEKADIIITHGGPASIFLAHKYNKKPIVVPRQRAFDEHVDDHQVMFTEKLQKMNKISRVIEINELKDIINGDSHIIDNIEAKNNFTERLEKIIEGLVSK